MSTGTNNEICGEYVIKTETRYYIQSRTVYEVRKSVSQSGPNWGSGGGSQMICSFPTKEAASEFISRQCS